MRYKARVMAVVLAAVCTAAWGVNVQRMELDSSHGFQFTHDGTFDGSGHFVMDDGDYVYRHLDAGDMEMEVSFSAVDMGGGLGAGNYRFFYYKVQHDASTFLLPFLQNGNSDSESTYFVVNYNVGAGTVNATSQYIGACSSFTLRVEYVEATGTYSISRSVNGGPMEFVVDVTGFGPSTSARHEYFYDQESGTPAGDVYPVMTMDYYEMNGQIDNFDDFYNTNWSSGHGTGFPVQAAEPNAIEGASCAQFEFGGQTFWDDSLTKGYGAKLNLLRSKPTTLTFWARSDNVGKERIHQLICYDGGNIARYALPIPTTSDWVKYECPIAGFVEDAGSTVDFTQISQIFFWATSWDTRGEKVYLDDLRLEVAEGAPDIGQIDSMDDIAGTGWTETRGTTLMVQAADPCKVEGSGSMRIAYENRTESEWDIVPERLFIAPTLDLEGDDPTALTFWMYNGKVGSERIVQMIIYAGSNLARYNVPTPGVAGWSKVICPISQFAPDATAPDYNAIDRIQFWVSTWDTPGGSIFIDDLQLEEYNPSLECPTQIDTFDDYAASGWFDNRGIGNVYQAPPGEVHEGDGSMKIDFEEITNVWDVVMQKNFAPNLDFSNAVDTCSLYLWEHSDPTQGRARLNQIILYTATLTGRFAVTNPVATGWREIEAPLDEFMWELTGSSPVELVEPNQVDWTAINRIDLWCTEWDQEGAPIYLDDMWLRESTVCTVTDAVLAQADKATITVDANPADWAMLDSDVIPMDLQTLPTPGDNGDMAIRYRMAWDDDYFYVLVEELPGDDLTYEAANFAAMDGGTGGDVIYDSIALFLDFDNNGNAGGQTPIDIWPILGFSSSGRTDLLIAWSNGGWGPHEPVAVANASMATSGSLGSRVIEARLKWTDMAAELNDDREPGGNLLAAIEPGFIFGCDPRLDDLDGAAPGGPFTANKGGAWFNGSLWTPVTGDDWFSIDVELICSPGDVDKNCVVDLADFGVLSAAWQSNACDNCNGWCNGADISTNGVVDINDLGEMGAAWLE